MKDRVFGWPKDDEKYKIRIPFAEMVKKGRIKGWEDSAVFSSVKVGLREPKDTNDWIPTTDLVLVHPAGESVSWSVSVPRIRGLNMGC